jgi:hypothetical protein
VEVTNQDRIHALSDYGFTEIQARFVVLVMRHAGLCIKRQYATFAGLPPGGAQCNGFFARLLRRGYATVSDCIHNRARLYHVHHKPLYHAIGEPESRYRRAVPARQAIERLMRLDAALIEPDLDWLTTRPEKLAYLAARNPGPTPNAEGEEPALPDPDLFPGTFPIGFEGTGRIVLVYVTSVPWTDDFRVYLAGHVSLLTVVPQWTVRVVLPKTLERYREAYDGAVYEELESPLSAATLDEARWYFYHRWRGDRVETIYPGLRERFSWCSRVFKGPRFARLYDVWRRDRNAPLRPVPASIAEARAEGRGQVGLVVLPHTYDSFSPLVHHRRGKQKTGTAEDEAVDKKSRVLNASLN